MKLFVNSQMIILLILFLFSLSEAQVINVPDDYSTIQEALNAAGEDYTVLVAPGTYKENLVWPETNGIALVGSGQHKTIIDGDKKDTVIEIDTHMDIIIQEMSIINGNAFYGGGLSIKCSHMILKKLTISDNFSSYGGGIKLHECRDAFLYDVTISRNIAELGGGIYLTNSRPFLENVIISNNRSDREGGGLYVKDSYPTLNNVNISNNTSEGNGGGIRLIQSRSSLSNVNISNNYAKSCGGGIFCGEVSIAIFSETDRCNILSNKAMHGKDIYSETNMSIVLDSFTVKNPTDYYAHPIDTFEFDIISGKNRQINADIYVSIKGSDDNTGLSPESPLKSIDYALSIIQTVKDNSHSIFFDSGIYSPESTDITFPIHLFSHVSLKGKGQGQTILDANNSGNIFIIEKVSNVSIEGVTIKNGLTNDIGGGIFINNADPNIFNVTVSNCASKNGGGFYIENSNPLLINVTLSNNTAFESGGGMYLLKANPFLENVTISNNTAKENGGGLYCHYYSNPVFSDVYRCSIFSNVAFKGNDIFSMNNRLHIILDSFTVKEPTSFHIVPVNDLSLDIISGKYPTIHSDMYVSPRGDNNNSGLSPESPLKSINLALSLIKADKNNRCTLYLDEGVFSPDLTDIKFPILIPNYVSIKGKGAHQTILDANQTGHVIVVDGVSEVAIDNLTIKNGEIGLYCKNSSPDIANVIISNNVSSGLYLMHSSPNFNSITICNNSGGGADLTGSNPIFNHVTISDNTGDYFGGLHLFESNPIFNNVEIISNTSLSNAGGVDLYESNPLFNRVIISNNLANSSGGGLDLYHSNPIFKNITISNNSATTLGGGINLDQDSSLSFSKNSRSCIFSNHAASGNDIYSLNKIHLNLDTFTVKEPTSYHTFPIDHFIFNIKSGKFKQINADLYVSPNGNDENLGTSFTSPLKSINYALSIIQASDINPHTIYIDSGTYSPESTGTKFPITMISNISLKGSGKNETIFDANNTASVIWLDQCHHVVIEDIDCINGKNFLVFDGGGIIHSNNSNFIIANANISSSTCSSLECRGGGLYLKNSDPILFNVMINENHSSPAAMCMSNSNPLFINAKITENQIIVEDLDDSHPLFVNVEITNNSSDFINTKVNHLFEYDHLHMQFINVTMSGNDLTNSNDSDLLSVSNSHINIINSILWNSTSKEITIPDFSKSSELTVAYSTIKGGKENISGLDENNVLNWLSGNHNLDPQFIDPTSKNYRLKPTSPCIDAGDPDFDKDGITWETDPNDQDPDGTRMDMGANLDRHFSVMHGRIYFLSSGKSVTDLTITSSSLIQKQADEFGLYAILLNPGENDISFEKPGYHPIRITQNNHSRSLIKRDIELTKIDYPLNIVVKNLPEADIDTPYHCRIRISGGTPPYEYTIVDGSLPTGLTLDTDHGTIEGTPTTPASYLFSVRITDETHHFVEMEYVIDVAVPPLTIVLDDTLKSAVKDETYHYQFETTGEGLPVVFSIHSGQLPSGMELSPKGLLSGTPTESGTYDFEIKVMDTSEQVDIKPFQMLITEPISIIGNQSCHAILCEPIHHSLSATGGYGKLTWEVQSKNLPAFLSLENGILSATPCNNWDTIKEPIIITARDSIGNIAYKKIFLHIVDQVFFMTDVLPEGVVGQPYSGFIAAWGGLPPYYFSFTGQLINGLKFNNKTGVISGTPTKEGSVNLEIIVSDSMLPVPQQVKKTFHLDIRNSFWIITPVRLPRAFKGRTINSIQLKTNIETIPKTWSIIDGKIADGIMLNAETGELSGKPTQSGYFTFTVECIDTKNRKIHKKFLWQISSSSSIYVSPKGDNNNSGLSPESPLQSINLALSMLKADQYNRLTIYLDTGVFSPDLTGTSFPLVIPSYVSIKGKGVHQTIIDANQTGNVFIVDDASEVTINNLTIKNGEMGLYCKNSSPDIANVIISNNVSTGLYLKNSNPDLNSITICNNSGGGAYLSESNPIITNVAIVSNTSGDCGGGLLLYESYPLFKSVTISNNSSSGSGGGLHLYYSNPIFKNVTISNNSASTLGGGIHLDYGSSLSFSEKSCCRIFSNHAGSGNDIYSVYKIHLNLDTFTVKEPTRYHAFPIDHFIFDIKSGKFKQINADLYVSPNGNDENLGTSFTSPLKSINYALSVIQVSDINPHTIYIDSGTYSPESTGTKFPITMISNVSLKGAGKNETIFDAKNTASVIWLDQCHHVVIEDIDCMNGKNFQVFDGGGIRSNSSNFIIANANISSNNCGWIECHGGGLYLMNSNPILFNVMINDNHSSVGGAIYMSNSNPLFINAKITENQMKVEDLNDSNPLFFNVEITNNSTDFLFTNHLFSYYNSNLQLINVTMSGNYLTNSSNDSYFLSASNSQINIINSILWNDSLKEISIPDYSESNELTIAYSTIKGGKENIVGLNEKNVLNWLSGNKNLEPQFIDPTQKNYRLKPTSPCIDAGDPDFDKDGITWETDPNDQDPDGTRMDMGANLDRHYSVMHGRISFLSSGKAVTDVTITSSSVIQKQVDEFGHYAVLLNPGENNISFEKPGYQPILITQSSNSRSLIKRDIELTKIDYPLNIVVRNLPEAEIDTPYHCRIRISGGTPPYEYTIVDGSLPTGLTLDNDYGTIAGTPTTPGSYLFSLRLTDETHHFDEMEYVIDVTVPPLTIVLDDTLKSAVKGDIFHYQFETTGERLPVVFSIHSGELPAGLDLSPKGLLSGIPTESGTYDFEIKVMDISEQIDIKPFQMLITEPISIIGKQSCYAILCEPIYHSLSATGGHGKLTWEVQSKNLPFDLYFNNGILSGNPCFETIKETITITVKDSIGNIAYKKILLQIVGHISFITDVLPKGAEDKPYSEFITIWGGLPPYHFSYTGQLIDGLKFNNNTGVISGTPTKGGIVNLEITVSDSMRPVPQQVKKTFSIDIESSSWIITPVRLPRAIKGQTINSIQLTTSSGTIPKIWSIIDGTIADGIVLNAETGELSGKPTHSGDFTFSVECIDINNQKTHKEFFWQISPQLSIQGPETIIVTTHQYVTHAFDVDGGVPPFKWFILSGSLPDGLEWNSQNATIFGTAHAEQVSYITILVYDHDSPTQFFEKVFKIKVVNEYELNADFDKNGKIELNDVILGLRVISHMESHNENIRLKDIVNVLTVLAGLEF